MKTKKLIIALVALGAYFNANAQNEWIQINPLPTVAVSRYGGISILPPSGTTGNSSALTNSNLSIITNTNSQFRGAYTSLSPSMLNFNIEYPAGEPSASYGISGISLIPYNTGPAGNGFKVNINGDITANSIITQSSATIGSLASTANLNVNGKIQTIGGSQGLAIHIGIDGTPSTYLTNYAYGVLANCGDASARPFVAQDANGHAVFAVSGNGDITSNGTSTLGNLISGNATYGLNIGLASSAALGYGTNYIGFQSLRNINTGNWTISSDGAHNGGGIMYTTVNGDMIFTPVASNSAGTLAQSISDQQVHDNAMLRITPLTVEAKQIQVKASVWADYVFKKDYKLRPLQDVESYINANSHLPEVQSEAEVIKNGINIAEMNATLLKKVEELTLYMIQQQKEIDALKVQVNSNK
jgi:hypothetical protein